jgi:predicted ATPase
VELPSYLASALHGLWAYYLARAEFHTAHTLAEQFLQVAQQEQNPALLLEAERELGQTLYFLGNLPEAQQYLERSFKRYHSQEHAAHVFLYGQDPGVVCLAHSARTLCLMGYLDQALQQADAAIVLAKEVAHPYSLALAQYQAAVVHHTRRDLQRTQEILEATVALSPEHGIPYWLSSMQVLKGWALANQGEYEAGMGIMRQGLTASREIGTMLNRSYSLVQLAEVCGAMGEAAEGLTLLHEAQHYAERSAGYFYLVEIYRLRGELTLQCEAQQATGNRQWAMGKIDNPQSVLHDPQTEAEACFQKAVEIARRQGAKLLELRAGMNLCRLWRQQGKDAQARQLLAPIYHWFTEGFDAIDLREAKMLLEELS